MSWLRAAVIRAVEAGAGGKDNITRTVRNVAGTVVYHAGNAVVEGAKIIQDRIGPRNMQGFKQTVKRLEEISVSSRGIERVQLLRRWLVALKEVDRFSLGSIEGGKNSPTDQLNEENKDSPKKPTLVYYVDPDMGGELKTFRDVFLTSQALEGITLSMILEEPNDEEESLLLEIYGLCLSGGKEVRQAVMTSVHNLAKAFSEYQDEILSEISYKEENVIILIDCGATHNFISEKSVKSLQLPIRDTAHYGVILGSGTAIQGKGVFEDVEIQLMNWSVKEEFLPLELEGVDVILGMQWLHSLGVTVVDWKNLTLTFSAEGKQICVKGDPSLTKARISLKSMFKTWLDQDEGYLIECRAVEVCEELEQSSTEIVQSESGPVQLMLKQFEDVFEWPGKFPPRRKIEHQITFEGGY
ncbi:myosin-11 isoform X1 [Cucumis melo var. makuwa]|uniref:Myosin-11 isoform X1 n=1 Tax=Cucumis melo var. makuwa TaxID=1194695 RepID=A0A5A7U1G6_CUCMM|nr:myosin-11 isoform X1 [Cucumis melo var. makuwa]